MRMLNPRQKGLAAVFAVAAGVALAAGCGGGGGGTSSPTPTPTPTACTPIAGTFTAVNANIFQPTCALSSCHGSGTPQDGLDLSSYAQIMATASNHTAVEQFNSASVKLLVPGSKETSYVFLKVIGAPGISLAQMPQTGQPLTACQTSALGLWIDQGLQNN